MKKIKHTYRRSTVLYPHNKDATLNKEVFENPGSEYRGTPFWAWNCELEKDELLRQLEVLKKMGMGGAHMHVRTGMATPYLSDEYMALIRACVEKCKEEKMLAWLYDEDRWPSGAAGGLLTKDEKYRARHLLFTATPYGEGKVIYGDDSRAEGLRSENGRLIACYDVVLDENGCLQSGRRIGEHEAALGRKWYAYVETDMPSAWYNNQTYANTLDKNTIQQFIRITHDRYLETIGDEFGTSVPAIFTDEPQFSHKQTLSFAQEVKDVSLPWTDDVPQTYQAAYGEDILDKLPELLWELPNGQVSVTRYHYHDHISERFASAFADTIGAWCEKNGIMLTGHMMEEPTLHSQTAALGDCMRSYRSFQLPGIDMLCNSFEFTTAKQAQSAAHQFGREGVLSELYGVTGWDFDFRGHKMQGDWQAALGVTVRVHHLAWVSMKGEAKRDYPAAINYQSPWWQDYHVVENHFARVNTAMTRGTPLVRVGVIHPVESFWLHWGPADQTHGARSQLDRNFQNLTSWLLKGGIDFDFICESLLPSQCEKGTAPLQVGCMNYDTILVPGCETLRATTLERLEAFRAAGGKLIFLGDAPALEDAVPSCRGRNLYDLSLHASFEQNAVLNALADLRLMDVRDAWGCRSDRYVHQLRKDGESIWLFLAHSGMPIKPDVPECEQIRIYLKGKHTVTLYDTMTGVTRPLSCTYENGFTVLHTDMYEQDSLLLRYDNAPAAQTEAAARPTSVHSLPVSGLAAYTLSEPNVLLLDKAEFALDDEPYHPVCELLRADNIMREQLGWPGRYAAVAQPWVIQEEKALHTARLRFTVHSSIAIEHAHFALEDAALAKLTVNGTPVTAKPDGYFTDLSIGTLPLPPLPAGDSTIEVILPFGKRTNIEWCYLLGNFGVELMGAHRQIVPLPEKLGYDCITRQRMPHYGGCVTWHVPVRTQGGALRVHVPQYAGAAIRVSIDGEEKGHIVFSPNSLLIPPLPAGDHEVQLTLLGHRQNCFGPLHRADLCAPWTGPDAWRTTGSWWTESYRVKPLGILTAPVITEEN